MYRKGCENCKHWYRISETLGLCLYDSRDMINDVLQDKQEFEITEDELGKCITETSYNSGYNCNIWGMKGE